MRVSKIYNIKNTNKFQQNLLNYSKNRDVFFFLNSNTNKTSNHLYSNYEMLSAFGIADEINIDIKNNFSKLKKFYNKNKDWIFGFFSYDLKNEIENLESKNIDKIKFPIMYFFIPKFVFEIKNHIVKIHYLSQFVSENQVDNIFKKINNQNNTKINNKLNIKINQRFSKNEYCNIVKKIKKHIKIGDIYEMNFCQEYFALNVDVQPVDLYIKLNEISLSPFSNYVKFKNKYLISSSPERFITKNKNKIISQPIKGTTKRGVTILEDIRLKKELESNEKERAENIMIVDLVRNDLSKTASKNSVKVEELCKIYSFEQVHQMISTISSKLNTKKFNAVDVIENAFPMGSMTGAPKVIAMKLIEKYEKTKRGLYSGSVGYFAPNRNFDFNVIIRSILYNATNKYLSYIVGGAITDKSIPENEYEECLIKAKAILKTLDIND